VGKSAVMTSTATMPALAADAQKTTFLELYRGSATHGYGVTR
jgi:hypothetical protein